MSWMIAFIDDDASSEEAEMDGGTLFRAIADALGRRPTAGDSGIGKIHGPAVEMAGARGEARPGDRVAVVPDGDGLASPDGDRRFDPYAARFASLVELGYDWWLEVRADGRYTSALWEYRRDESAVVCLAVPPE